MLKGDMIACCRIECGCVHELVGEYSRNISQCAKHGKCFYCYRTDGNHTPNCGKPQVWGETYFDEGGIKEREPFYWRITLNRYQRDNLLMLFAACGYPVAGLSGSVPPFTFMNNGDWVGEIPNMLAIGPKFEGANTDLDRLKYAVTMWKTEKIGG